MATHRDHVCLMIVVVKDGVQPELGRDGEGSRLYAQLGSDSRA